MAYVLLDGGAAVTTILLGPQRFRTTAGAAVRSLGVEGPVATITAGWEDRERDDAELDQVLDGRSRNLGLYARLADVLTKDPTVAAATLAHRDAMEELAGLYSLRLQRALESLYQLRRRSGRSDLVESATRDSMRAIQAIDAWYLDAVDQLYGELDAAAPAAASPVLSEHRHTVAATLAASSVVAIAGGHVGMLLWCLRLFDVRLPAHVPVVAWSAGAMAVTDTVVLYNDNGPQGVRGSEVWDRGLGRVPGVVAMPHARRRLDLDDPMRAEIFVGRFGGTCLLLDDGARVDLADDATVPPGTKVLTAEGVGVLGAPPAVGAARAPERAAP